MYPDTLTGKYQPHRDKHHAKRGEKGAPQRAPRNKLTDSHHTFSLRRKNQRTKSPTSIEPRPCMSMSVAGVAVCGSGRGCDGDEGEARRSWLRTGALTPFTSILACSSTLRSARMPNSLS